MVLNEAFGESVQGGLPIGDRSNRPTCARCMAVLPKPASGNSDLKKDADESPYNGLVPLSCRIRGWRVACLRVCEVGRNQTNIAVG